MRKPQHPIQDAIDALERIETTAINKKEVIGQLRKILRPKREPKVYTMPRIRIDELIAKRRESEPKADITYDTVGRAVLKSRGKMTDTARYLTVWKMNKGVNALLRPAELMALAKYFRTYDIRELLDMGPRKTGEDDGA